MTDTSTSTNGGAIGARVDNLEKSVSAIRGDIASLSQLVVASQKTPWSTLISGAGFIVVILMAFGGIFASSMARQIDDNKAAIHETRDDLKEMVRAIVPRGEHEERWRSEDQAIVNLQKQIDSLKSDFGSTYSLRDALADMTKRLDKLEDHGAPKP